MNICEICRHIHLNSHYCNYWECITISHDICYGFDPVTNREYYRKMGDYQLASLIVTKVASERITVFGVDTCRFFGPYANEFKTEQEAIYAWVEWLQQKVKVDRDV